MFRRYYYLAKPGIIYGNLLTAVAGFLLATSYPFNTALLIATLGSIALVIGSGCVFNNYYDIDIDGVMERTKNRALVTGDIKPTNALIYGAILGILGFGLLVFATNTVTVIVGLIGYIDYVLIYGPLKRRSVSSTIVGAVSGSTAIVAGYTAVTGRIDLAAIILFTIMILWQVAHFNAIAIYRSNDYDSAQIPILPSVMGMARSIKIIVLFIFLFIVATMSLTLFGYTGYTYLFVMGAIGIAWLWAGVDGIYSLEPKIWARKTFFYSLVVILVFSLMTALGHRLP